MGRGRQPIIWLQFAEGKGGGERASKILLCRFATGIVAYLYVLIFFRKRMRGRGSRKRRLAKIKIDRLTVYSGSTIIVDPLKMEKKTRFVCKTSVLHREMTIGSADKNSSAVTCCHLLTVKLQGHRMG